jgi:hypothetical protein
MSLQIEGRMSDGIIVATGPAGFSAARIPRRYRRSALQYLYGDGSDARAG